MAGDPFLDNLQWLVDLGLDRQRLSDLNPCVPGEFTMPGALYVNTGSPRIVYHGTEEGTLPLVAGRWYLIPTSVVAGYPTLSEGTYSVSRAVRLVS